MSPKISNSEGANTSIQQSHFVSANSHGFIGGYATTRHGLSCSVIAGEGDAMQREYWYDSRRDPTELMAAEDIGRLAGERALARLGAKKIRTCEVPVIFEAPLAVALVGNFVQAVSGGSLYRKSSFLLDSLGQQVFSPVVSIAERPHLKKAFGSSPFDSDGVATRDREVVTDGVLNGYFLSTYSARKLGMQTTGNAGGSHNLIVKPGEQDLAALIKQMDRGPARHRAARPRRELRHGRLLARCGRLLGREGQDQARRRGDHHRRQPARHVPQHRRGGQRRPAARRQAVRFGADRAHEGRRALSRLRTSGSRAAQAALPGQGGAYNRIP